MNKRLPLFATAIVVAVASLFLNPQISFAQTPASAVWPLTTDASVSTLGAITGTPYTWGPGLAWTQYNATAGATSAGGMGTSFADAQTNNAYYEFSVSPAGGNDLTVDSISFTHVATTFTTAGNYVLQCSMDGFTTTGTDIGLSGSIPTIIMGQATVSNTFSKMVSNGQALTLRIYVWNQPSGFSAYSTSNFTVYGNTLAVGVENLSKNSSVGLYPNPVVSSSVLKLNKVVNNAELVIYDATGAVALKQIINGDQAVIEKGDLTQGVYFAILNEGSNRLIQKLIIQ